jgi:hypothetical protein
MRRRVPLSARVARSLPLEYPYAMKSRVFLLGSGLGVLLACGGEAHTTLFPPPVLSAGAGGAGGAAVQGGRSGASGAAATDAGVDASDASGGGVGGLAGAGGFDEPDGSTDPGGPVPITIDPASIVFFDLPIDSVRFGAAGFDPASGVCAAIIWDYSNNDLEIERHCDDFGTYPRFPYVLVRKPPESCDDLQGLWDYDGLEPEVASGCVDPLAETVNVQLDVFSVPTLYRIVMNNEP